MAALARQFGGMVGPPTTWAHCQAEASSAMGPSNVLLRQNRLHFLPRNSPLESSWSGFRGNSSAFARQCQSQRRGGRSAPTMEDGRGRSSVSERRDASESLPIRYERGEGLDSDKGKVGQTQANLKDAPETDTNGAGVVPAKVKGGDSGKSGPSALGGGLLLGALGIGLVVGMGALGVVFKEQINEFLIYFSSLLDTLGPAGYVMFVFVYAGLEVLAIPAIPLTLSAGLLFGQTTGTVIVSTAGTMAATASFLIARYLARDRILKLAESYPKFVAIDKAIGKNSFKVVTLLRLSPLMPFSLGNYLYGLTSVKLIPYVLGSWLGMLPGTFAYVSAGSASKLLLGSDAQQQMGGTQFWTLGLGIAATVLATWYVTRLAKNAMDEVEEEA